MKLAMDSALVLVFINFLWAVYILIRISLKLAPYCLIDNKSVLVRVMAWHRTGDKPLPEPMLHGLVRWRIYTALGGDENWNARPRLHQLWFIRTRSETMNACVASNFCRARSFLTSESHSCLRISLEIRTDPLRSWIPICVQSLKYDLRLS